MAGFIEQYFSNRGNTDSVFSPPASAEQIEEAGRALGLQWPDDYKAFLQTTNGFEGVVGEFYVVFEPVDNIPQSTQDHCSGFFPWAVFIGSNGGGEMFVLDTRTEPARFGLLPYIGDNNDFIPLGNTFEQFLKRLKEGTAFQQ